MLKLYDKMFIAYGSVINAVGIIFCHLLYFTWETAYFALSPYLSTVFGVQLIKAISDLRLSYKFHFCDVTRFNNWCYLIICVVYMVFYWLEIPDLYTVIIQTILAVIGLVSFIWLYTKKNPNCRISLYLKAKKNVIVLFGNFVKLLPQNDFGCENTLEDLKKHQYKKHVRDGKMVQ